MAFFELPEDYDVKMAEGYVKQAESHLASMKQALADAKRLGNYKNSGKNCILPNGKYGNGYDSNVYHAQMALKRRKEDLAKAKQRLKEDKLRKKEAEKREKEAEKIRKQEAAERKKEEKKNASSSRSSSSRSSSSSSSSRSSSSSYSSSSSSYSSSSSSSGNSSSRSSSSTYDYEAVRKRNEEVKELVKYVKEVCPIENVSDTFLARNLTVLLEMLRKFSKECKESYGTSRHSLACSCRWEIKRLAKEGCLQLRKKNKSLYYSPDVQKVVKEIDPDLDNKLVQFITGHFYEQSKWVFDKIEWLKVKLGIKWLSDKIKEFSNKLGNF